MASVTIECPHCAAPVQIAHSVSGKKIKCGACGRSFLAPIIAAPVVEVRQPSSPMTTELSTTTVDDLLPPTLEPHSLEPPVSPQSTSASVSSANAGQPFLPVDNDPGPFGQTSVPADSHPILVGDEEQEVRRVSRETRTRRRQLRNVIMWTLGALILLFTALILLRR